MAVNGGMAAVSSAVGVNSSSCEPAGELDSSGSSIAVGNANISSSFLCSSNRIISIYHATSSVVPFLGSNDFVHRHNIYTSVED